MSPNRHHSRLMGASIPTTVLRHPKERIAKCSLRPLHGRPEMTFLRAPRGSQFDASGFTMLVVGAPALSAADAGRPLLLPDSTWRWLPQLLETVVGEPVRRSIPAGVPTAYPRSSRLFADPEAGLASVEALYLARRILGDDDPTLLDGYHWKDRFLAGLQLAGLQTTEQNLPLSSSPPPPFPAGDG